MITPGLYRNQLIIDVPYITLKNADPSKEVKLTWYYGIGYNYYSADMNGWYDEDLAYDKFSKRGVAKWGAATYIKEAARAFRAEGITFETQISTCFFKRKSVVLNGIYQALANHKNSSKICVYIVSLNFIQSLP